ncbi:MAG: hypothetical protein CMD16_01215 [Flavobacteriales bacterium]|nr:hypothetical protein [Flavobacteriales bacterium]|tara:strand:- start:29651 stop:30100 length:450 start_codon:yes stop_codon:yes gene_type:complete
MKKFIIILFGLLLFNNLLAQKHTTKYITEANKIGLEWWNQVNTSEYQKAYNLLSDILKTRFTFNSWKKQISLLMDEYGTFENRSVIDTYFMSEIEGLEDGFYVVIKYRSEYTKTKNHTENLLLKQNDNLKWEIFDFNYEFQNIEVPEKL